MDPSHHQLEKEYLKGALVSARAYRVLNHGVEFRLENQVEGIVRNRELSWDAELPDVYGLIKIGQLALFYFLLAAYPSDHDATHNMKGSYATI